MTVNDLKNNLQIIGTLEKPLGTVVRVKGICVDGSTSRTKALEGKVLLKIDDVNGKRLNQPCIVEYRFLKNDLEHLKSGAAFSYMGYESGEFAGIPKEAFEHINPITTQTYHFRTFFVVLRKV